MKKMIFLITAVLFLLASTVYAQDSARTEVKKENKEYQNFIDKNNNGINDRLEEQQKKTTKVEQKRNEQKSESPTAVGKPDSGKTEIKDTQQVDTKTEIKKDSVQKPKSE
jgi:hypothetical protein